MAPVRSAASGGKSLVKRAEHPQLAEYNGGAGLPSGNRKGAVSEVQAGVGDQQNALRVVLLEAEVRAARSLNLQLQQQMALLQNQVKAQHQDIEGLHDQVRALETELEANKASAVVQVTSGLSSSTAAAISLAANRDAPRSPKLAPASTQAPAMHAASGGQKQEMAFIDAPSNVTTCGTCDVSTAYADDLCANAINEMVPAHALSGMKPPRGDAEALGNGIVAVQHSNGNDISTCVTASLGTSMASEAALSSGSDDVRSMCSQASAGILAEDASSTQNTALASVLKSDLSLRAETSDEPTTRRSLRRRRHSLRDFWNSDSIVDVDDSPPASNTRRNHHRASQQQGQGEFSVPVGDGTAQAGTALATTLRASREKEAYASMTHAGETLPIAKVPETAAHSGRGGAVKGSNLQTTRQLAHSVVLRHAVEEKEHAEGSSSSSSHLLDCASCQTALPVSGVIGRCAACPRSFCASCLEADLREQGAEFEAMGADSRAILDGRQGDFDIDRCPQCLRGRDREFSAPPDGTAPMDHLLSELLRHDLSLCFREPVDISKHPDYVENVGRNAMMDLGTMARKLRERRYPRRRGPGQFLEDLSRVWRNCRRYAGCDELGKPHFGGTVPGIVRCALTLEALALKYCAAHMSGNEGSASWQESTWDFHRQEQERANAAARLKQLEVRLDDGAGIKTSSPSSAAVEVECPLNEDSLGRSGSGKSGEEQDDRSRRRDTIGFSRAATAAPSATESRNKRDASKMDADGESMQLGTSRRARILVDVTAANSARVSNAARKIEEREERQGPQQAPWSPLDRLCDLAAAYVQ